MLQLLRMDFALLAIAGFAFASFGMGPAEAACQLITATHSALALSCLMSVRRARPSAELADKGPASGGREKQDASRLADRFHLNWRCGT